MLTKHGAYSGHPVVVRRTFAWAQEQPDGLPRRCDAPPKPRCPFELPHVTGKASHAFQTLNRIHVKTVALAQFQALGIASRGALIAPLLTSHVTQETE